MSYTVSKRSRPRVLASGRPVAPGDEIPDREALQNPRLIDRGVLIKQEVPKKKQPASTPAKETESKPAPKNPEEAA